MLTHILYFAVLAGWLSHGQTRSTRADSEERQPTTASAHAEQLLSLIHLSETPALRDYNKR